MALVRQGFFQSREKAKRAIMAGLVFVDGQLSDKAGNLIKEDAVITVKGNNCPFVSRGGLKLAKAIEKFNLDLKDKIAMDVGASTGGFTDCMLQNGAIKVYSIDVGYGQLDWKLREDPRVVNMEKCNFRYLTSEEISDAIEFASIDVSFISLKLIFPVLWTLMKDGGKVVALVKPQFEAGKEQVGKNGIVREKKVHLEVLERVFSFAAESGFKPENLSFSPITGAKGNIEYLLELVKGDKMGYNVDKSLIEGVVNEAHSSLA